MPGLGDLFGSIMGAGRSMLSDAASGAPMVAGNPGLDDLAQGNRLGALNLGMLGGAGALAAGRVAKGAYDTASTLPGVMDSFAQGGGTAPVSADQIGGVTDIAALAGGTGSPLPKPAGAVGSFGGRVSLAGEDPLAAKGAQYATNSNYVPERRFIEALPEPLSIVDKAVDQTRGMTTDQILASEPLWGHSAAMARAQGVPEHEAFSDLANQLFSAHGTNSYFTPHMARTYMARERLKYGLSPFGEQ